RPDALLFRWTNTGTLRDGGGAYERRFLSIWAFGPDGVTYIEQFDAECDAEALDRFYELTAEHPAAPSPRPKALRRRFRPNAATAHVERHEAAVAARDADSLAAELADDVETVDHATGTTYDRQGVLFSFRSAFKARGLVYESVPLATLGDSLVLLRARTSG